jgi:battenin
LLFFSFLPLIMLASFYLVLPLGPLKAGSNPRHDYEAINGGDQQEDDEALGDDREQDGLLSSSVHSVSGRSFSSANRKGMSGAWGSFRANLNRARGLFFP